MDIHEIQAYLTLLHPNSDISVSESDTFPGEYCWVLDGKFEIIRYGFDSEEDAWRNAYHILTKHHDN